MSKLQVKWIVKYAIWQPNESERYIDVQQWSLISAEAHSGSVVSRILLPTKETRDVQ